MSVFDEKLRLKEQADEDIYFARHDRELLARLRQRLHAEPPGGGPTIVSGGQTGVDRAALDAALDLGLGVGGWCPQGRRAEDGRIDERYPLQETPSRDYPERTEWNVRDSDATLILYRGALGGGSLLTAQLARRAGRPLLTRDLEAGLDDQDLVAWLLANEVRVLNCAGPRESTAPGIQAQALTILGRVFSVWASHWPRPGPSESGRAHLKAVRLGSEMLGLLASAQPTAPFHGSG